MANYKKLESVEVNVNENYSIVAEVNFHAMDSNKYSCNLWLNDNETGVRILIKENVSVNSYPDQICDKVAGYLEMLVDNGYFNDDIKTVENFIDYVTRLKEVLCKQK